ncbi:hypothetical protein SADUNF_Sadunf08G0169700 [Salix dunnii]|uniref:Uncharacterized protein n=1 Tax=Salix dunnii TaxID=1413687 RepID=A0A835JV08_9ROSI|nr:hypothetical protein SADUNF_Sadunf08G0169700 [Salix dunnii]
MGCGKSKHDVAAGNTITLKKSDVGSNKSNKDLGPTVEETSPHNSNTNILKEQKEEHIPSQEPPKEVVACVQDANVEAVAGVQDAIVEAVAAVQDANVEVVSAIQNENVSEELEGGGKDVEIKEESVVEKQEPGKLISEEAVAGVQDENVKAFSAVQNANESEELEGGGKDVEIKEESVVEKQEPGKLISEKAVADVQDENVKAVSAIQNENVSEELEGGGKDVEIKEESVVEKQEPEKLISEESPDNVSEGKSEESLSNESAELDDVVAKETLVGKETKQAAENEESQATKQENADVEPEVANPTAELEINRCIGSQERIRRQLEMKVRTRETIISLLNLFRYAGVDSSFAWVMPAKEFYRALLGQYAGRQQYLACFIAVLDDQLKVVVYVLDVLCKSSSSS